MNILIIEDNKTLSYLWQEALEDRGFSHTAVTSCRAGRHAAANQKYDACVLDLYVDDGDTLELSNWLTMIQGSLPVIMLTGADELPMGQHTQIPPGVNWLLRKPIKPAELVNMVEYLASTQSGGLKHSHKVQETREALPAQQAC